jgi:hypothetical protein
MEERFGGVIHVSGLIGLIAVGPALGAHVRQDLLRAEPL